MPVAVFVAMPVAVPVAVPVTTSSAARSSVPWWTSRCQQIIVSIIIVFSDALSIINVDGIDAVDTVYIIWLHCTGDSFTRRQVSDKNDCQQHTAEYYRFGSHLRELLL